MPNSSWMSARDGAGGQLAVGEQLEDATPHRVTQDVERVHMDLLSKITYIRQVF